MQAQIFGIAFFTISILVALMALLVATVSLKRAGRAKKQALRAEAKLDEFTQEIRDAFELYNQLKGLDPKTALEFLEKQSAHGGH